MHASFPPLLECFDISPTVRTIAMVGGGGKTSLMFALAREMVTAGRLVVTTTTTRIFPPSRADSPCIVLVGEDPGLVQLPAQLARHRHVTVAERVDENTGKLVGVSDDTVRTCLGSAQHILVEADGAAGRPIKSPEPWEPVIPPFTDMVIPVVGLDCLEKYACGDVVFRLGRFLAVTGLSEGALIDTEAIASAITHAEGGLKGVSPAVSAVPFLNKLDVVTDPNAAEQIAHAIFRTAPQVHRVVAGQLKGPSVPMVFRRNRKESFFDIPGTGEIGMPPYG